MRVSHAGCVRLDRSALDMGVCTLLKDAQQPWKKKGGMTSAGALESGESETTPPNCAISICLPL